MTGEQSAAGAAFARLRAVMAVNTTTAPEKAVLLVLAIMANTAGETWPAVRGPSGIAARCSLGERTVARALRGLEAAGHISTRHVLGKGSIYTVHPCQSGTPATAAGVPERQGTPARAAAKQPRTTNKGKVRASASNPYPMPEGVDPAAWRDFLANRARKRHPNTASAHKRLMDDLARHGGDEWTAARLVEHAAAHGWAGIYDPRKGDTRNGTVREPRDAGADSLRGSRPDPAVDMLRHAHARADDTGGGGADRGGVGAALPAYLRG